MNLSIRNQRRIVRYTYVIGSSTLLVLLVVLMDYSILVLLPGLNLLLSFRYVKIPRLLERLLIPIATCRACGAQFDLIDRWLCPCGYTSEMPTNIFRRCKNCGRSFDYIFCPRCEVSLDI